MQVTLDQPLLSLYLSFLVCKKGASQVFSPRGCCEGEINLACKVPITCLAQSRCPALVGVTIITIVISSFFLRSMRISEN